MDFLRPFRGVFKDVHYDSAPLRKAFPNHPSCRGFEEFMYKEIQSRIPTGAVKVWGKVGVKEPPVASFIPHNGTIEASLMCWRSVPGLMDGRYALLPG